MDLSEAKYVEDLNQPFSVFTLLLLLSLVPFLLTVVTTLWRRRGSSPKKNPAGLLTGLLSKLPGAKRTKQRTLRMLAAISALFLAGPVIIAALSLLWFDVLVLDELLQIPGGDVVALGAIVTGVLVGLLVTTRPRPRALWLAAGAWGVIAVLGSLLFASLQSAPADNGGGHDGPATGRAPVELVTPSESTPAQETPSDPATPSATASATASESKAPYDPAHIVLPNGTYETTPICLFAGDMNEPVGVKALSADTPEATQPNGAVVRPGDFWALSDCAQKEGADPQLYRAPAAAVMQLDGAPYPLDGTVTFILVAMLESDSGEQLALVIHRVDGTTMPGLVRVDQLRQG